MNTSQKALLLLAVGSFGFAATADFHPIADCNNLTLSKAGSPSITATFNSSNPSPGNPDTGSWSFTPSAPTEGVWTVNKTCNGTVPIGTYTVSNDGSGTFAP